jgi:dTDP-L-rhamnose 4-epimerase
MNTVLITGGAGFIGSHLSKLLLSSGFNVRILDTLSPQIHGQVPHDLEWLEDRRVNFLRGSVTDRLALTSALEGVEYVVHLAAETGTGQSMYEISRYNEVNSQGTAILLDILANRPKHSVRRIVLASSRSIYGEGAYVCMTCGDAVGRVFPGPRPASQLAAHRWEHLCKGCGSELTAVATKEGDRVRPVSIYASTKVAQEDLVRVACEALGIGYSILRLQNVYGEGQSLRNPYTGVLSILSTRVRCGLQLRVFEDGLESRDFVHVSDVVQAMLLSLTTAISANTVINVGSGVATPLLDVAVGLSEALGYAPDVRVTAEYRFGDIRHNLADITRLAEVLGFTPQVSLRDGLLRFCNWVLTQPVSEDLLDRTNAELRARNLMG